MNKSLLQGPDLTNKLVGVLSRFRENPIAVTGDIEKMFYQVKIDKSHNKFVRFLCWEEGNVDNPVSIYEMNAYLFGATSSPSCSSYALNRAAQGNEALFGSDGKRSVERDFYVDGFKSYPSTGIGQKSVSDMWTKGSFSL